MNARDRPRRAWVTLLTRSSYLPGVLLLHYSLLRVKSAYPLIVLVTPSLPESSVAALRALNIIVEEVQPLRPLVPVHIVAERFADTWDKLRVFGLDLERAVMVDGDMLLVQNMDDLFEMELPANGAGIAANHACICNWTRDPWAADDWRPWGCGFTHAQLHGTPPTPPASGPPHTLALLNSGLFVLAPSHALGAAIEAYVHESPLVSTFAFPDQDMLGYYFAGRWTALPWDVNAIKTARYWHPQLWTDGGVRNVHYIVDKPWAVPRSKWASEDAITHGWWWDRFYAWRDQCVRDGKDMAVTECERYMLGRKGEAPPAEGSTVGEVESWEESVQKEREGRDKGYVFPPGEPWNVEIDGIRW